MNSDSGEAEIQRGVNEGEAAPLPSLMEVSPLPPAPAAAAALPAVPSSAALVPLPPSDGQDMKQGCYPAISRQELCSSDGYFCLALISPGVCLVSRGPTPRVDTAGKPACERCGVRLSRVGSHRPWGVGRACHPQCKVSAVTAATPPVPKPPQSRKRRAQSDPGEPAPEPELLQPRRLRPRKQSEEEMQILMMLEETHARRMAWLADAATLSSSSSPPAPSSSSPSPPAPASQS